MKLNKPMATYKTTPTFNGKPEPRFKLNDAVRVIHPEIKKNTKWIITDIINNSESNNDYFFDLESLNGGLKLGIATQIILRKY